MEKPGVLNFKVGQLVEMRTFETGFRGAWFRSKIKEIPPDQNKILLEYYDFELEEPSWVKIYQLPPYGRKLKHLRRPQLMVRPQYPAVYCKSEMPSSVSQVCVICDGTWKVDDLVDWYKDDCFWSATIVKVLSDSKVQLELPMPPVGQGKEGEDGKHEAFCKDLRPSLDWSETEGWSLPTVGGRTSCDAYLIFPTEQGMGPEVENAEEPAAAGMDLEAEHAAAAGMDLEVEHAEAAAAAAGGGGGSPVNASSTTRISAAEGDEVSEQNVKRDGDLMESSESSSSLHVKKRKADEEEEVELKAADEKIELNITREPTLEAALLDLEELINKVDWMQGILQSPANAAAADTSSWKLA